MLPRAEIAHWLFAAGFLFFGLVILAEALVGPHVFRQRLWRACLSPALALLAGVWLWVITVFSTFSTLHLLAHSVWAQAATAAGAVQLGVPGPRAERLAVRALRVSPPPDRVDARRRLGVSARRRAPPTEGRLGIRRRRHMDRARCDAVLGS
jgi:hypothetical protein